MNGIVSSGILRVYRLEMFELSRSKNDEVEDMMPSSTYVLATQDVLHCARFKIEQLCRAVSLYIFT